MTALSSFCLPLMLLAVLAPASAGVREMWRQRHASLISSIEDQVMATARDQTGNVIVAGHTGEDALLLKYSAATGAVLWQQSYNSPGNWRDGWDGVAVDAAGNVVTAGFTWNGEDYDYNVAKYAAADGALLWMKRYDGPEHGNDHAVAVAVDRAGNIVVTGESGQDDYDGFPYQGDYLTRKYNGTDGALLWERRFVQQDFNWPHQPVVLSLDGSGNAVLAGFSTGEEGAGNERLYVAKYATADGAVLWERHGVETGTGVNAKRAVTVDGEGNVIVAGDTPGESGMPDLYAAKLAAADGAVLWEQRYHASNGRSDSARAVAVDAEGNVVVAGSSEFQNAPPDSALLPDFYTAKYAAKDGAVLWECRYNGPADGADEASAVAVDSLGNVTVAGASDSTLLSGVLDIYTAHYAGADGAQLWERRYNGPANGSDSAVAVTVGGAGEVTVTGYSMSGADTDIYTASYAAADGALRWDHRYAGLAPANGGGRSVAVDRDGNVLVTGDTDGDDTGVDFLTAKYSPSGALLWQRRYDGPASRGDYARALALDAAGNAVVTGQSDGGAGTFDYYTAKYAAADGAILWEHRYNGTGNHGDYPSDVAVDAAGNVVVTGYSTASNTAYDFYTAKYAAADGALLWEQRYTGGAAYALALDAAGNAAVTGAVWRGGGLDYQTIKYAAANGAALWETTYNAPGGGFDEPFALAVDSAGNVIVTGYSGGSFYTAKYAAASGALLWGKRHGNANIAWAVAVDSADNVIVTGGSSGSEADTVKYAAADGAVLWQSRSAISGGGKFVAVDPGGDVVVTGWAPGGAFTAKYAAADGASIWGVFHDSSRPDGITPGGLAIGQDGAVVITGAAPGPEFSSAFATAVFRQFPPPLSFVEWAAGYGLNGVSADFDPDNDGVSSGLEFVLGGNPAESDPVELPAATVSENGMVFHFRREDESETPDMALVVQAGSDLAAWPAVFTIGATTAASSPGVSIVENGLAADTITVTIPSGTASRLYARLKVTVTP